MPNATAHRLGAALSIYGLSAYAEHKNGENTAAPLAHATRAGMPGTLPDVLEPAIHPHHRQFFHSLTFAALMGYGLNRLYRWETETELQQALRTVGLIEPIWSTC